MALAMSPEDSTAVRLAIIAVKSAAASLEASDTDAIRSALTDVRDAVLSAGVTLTKAEENVRYRIAERPS